MSDNQEPHPPQPNALWVKDSDAYNERFEYINNRVETYLENFKQSIEYDFTTVTPKVEEAQKQLLFAFEHYACGSFTVDTVKNYALLLRNAFKRPEQAPSPLAQARQNRTANKGITESNFIPGSFYIDGARKVSGDRVTFWIRENNKRLFFAGEKPPPGVTSCMVEGGGGFLADGSAISQYEAERIINDEITELLIKHFGGAKKAFAQEPEDDTKTLSKTEPTLATLDTGGKPLEQIKAEAEAIKNKPKTPRRSKKLD